MIPFGAEAAPCTPTATTATELGPAYLQAGGGANPGAGTRYVTASAGFALWAESNGIVGLQTSATQTCGAATDIIIAGSDDGGFVDGRSTNFGAHACETNPAQPQGFCPVTGG